MSVLTFALGNSMANPQEFLHNWVRESVQTTPYRNKAEARRLAYECRKSAEKANVSWLAVIMAAGGDVQGYILTRLNQETEQGPAPRAL
jgi:hypothetical protein